MSEEPEILLQRASLQPHMPLPVWTRPPLRIERCSSGGLRLSGGNPPEPRKHMHSKGGVCLPLLRRNHTTRVGRYWWTPVVSWSSQDLYWLSVLILTLCLVFWGGGFPACWGYWTISNQIFPYCTVLYIHLNEPLFFCCSFCENGELKCSEDCGKLTFYITSIWLFISESH